MKNLPLKKMLVLAFTSLTLFAHATIIKVTVANISFTPSSFNAVVGDTIEWIWASGTHTTTSTSVPAGANTWNNPMTSSSTTFQYVITTAGTYNYWCAIHTTMMEGTFTAIPNGVPVISGTSEVFASVFPNPASSVLTIKLVTYNPNNELVITDISGKEIDKETLKDINTNIDVSKWAKGVYFYKLRRDKETMEGKFEVQ